MQFNITYESDVANAPVGFKACVNAACQYLGALLTDPVTVNIQVGWGTTDGQKIDAGASGQSIGNQTSASFSQILSALQAKGTAGSATLPQTAPLAGSVTLTTAEAKALGLAPASTALDGYIGVDSTSIWGFDPTESKPLSPNADDLVSTIEHEITEVLGRVSYLDQTNTYGVIDLFRYAAAGQRQLTTGDPSFFSVDGGKTLLAAFNNFQTGDKTGDLADWAATPEIADSFGVTLDGVLCPVTAADKQVIGSLGYTETAASQALTVAGAVPQLGAVAAVSALASGADSYVTISDSGANIAANFAALASDYNNGQIAGLAITDTLPATLTVTADQYPADQAMLAATSGNYVLTIDASAANGITLAGVAGHGTIVKLSGSAGQYSLTPGGDGSSFTLVGPSGTDHFSSVTALAFGGSLDFVAAKPGDGTAGHVTSGNVTELYGAVFGRAPDVAGLAYYQQTAQSTPALPLTVYAQWFLASPEYVGNTAHNYSQDATGDAAFVTDLYQNLLHRAPATGDAAWYEANVIMPTLQGATPGSAGYTSALAMAHAIVVTDFSQSAEFLGAVQITAAHPADSQHWLYLI